MSANTLTIVDESASGEAISEIVVKFRSSRVTIRDIISSRVQAEVERYNANVSERFYGLVRPSQAEDELNGFRMHRKAIVDAEKQVYVALAAFQQNGYFVFVDDRQADSLDDEVQVRPETKVSFVKLTPLVGG